MKINRLFKFIAAAAAILISVSAVESSVRADEDPPGDPRIKKGFEIAPVPTLPTPFAAEANEDRPTQTHKQSPNEKSRRVETGGLSGVDQ